MVETQRDWTAWAGGRASGWWLAAPADAKPPFAGKTLADVALAINARGAGVKAYVAQTADGTPLWRCSGTLISPLGPVIVASACARMIPGLARS